VYEKERVRDRVNEEIKDCAECIRLCEWVLAKKSTAEHTQTISPSRRYRRVPLQS